MQVNVSQFSETRVSLIIFGLLFAMFKYLCMCFREEHTYSGKPELVEEAGGVYFAAPRRGNLGVTYYSLEAYFGSRVNHYSVIDGYGRGPISWARAYDMGPGP